MAYRITENCLECGACYDECPQGAVAPGNPYKINPETCIDCGNCQAACPNSAILAD